MNDDSKENSSPVDATNGVSDDDLVVPLKRVKLGDEAANGFVFTAEKTSSGASHEAANDSNAKPAVEQQDAKGNKEIITISDNDDNSELSSSNRNGSCSPNRDSSKKRAKMTEAERAERERQRLRKAEERRIKAEQLLAAKELRLQKKKEREALAEKRKIEKEKALKEREEQKKLAMERKKAEEEAKRQKEKEREEQRRLAQEKKKAEEEAKRQREKEREQRRKEEEEKKEQRRREEEEKREKKRKEQEAEESRKKRESDRFLSFFSKVERPVITYAASITEGPALPFEVKEGMVLAPIQRRPPLSPNSYKNLLSCNAEKPYLSNLPRRMKTARNEMRAKLFQFHDNCHPAYYGTWRKRSKTITGRNPFAKDTEMLDYEVDSDDEWEDEPEGEDCDDDSDRSDESEMSDEEDDGFFVEHGYLSDGEGSGNEEDANVHEDEAERRRRLHALAEDWENTIKERSTKKKLLPRLYGPVFGLTNVQTPAHLQPIYFFNYD
ncbi:unnamed protein product [Toxocara canis]|uniref:Chromatin assembly factor 1 subunit A n=1 Tax=Toxocara canis TaxID=6265 RepID=A0A183V649_TOXCA|nr:unnamed protein product [Toxocara canis]